MRLGGRTQAAIEILDDIAARTRPVADALRGWGLNHRFAGSADRGVIANLVYDSLRKKASQSWRMDDDTGHSLAFATLMDQWARPADQLAAAFADDRFAPPMPAPDRLAAWSSRSLNDAPDWVRADIPQWSAPYLEASLGADWVSQAAALGLRAPLDLRVNTLKADRAKVVKALSRFDAKPGSLFSTAVRIAAGSAETRLPNVQAEAGFQKGWFEIQDEGSQMVAALAAARPGEQVLDLCAGAGGKTLAMAAAMANKGQIHAFDADRNRLAPIHDRLKRAGARNVQVVSPHQSLDHLAGKMDLVVIDAPCTGSGTWRRRPDAKWRISEEALERRQQEQSQLLRDAMRYLRPGGRLLYITCSLFGAENEDRVSALISEEPMMQLATPDETWSSLCQTALHKDSQRASMMLTPLSCDTDGFYAAMLKRNG